MLFLQKCFSPIPTPNSSSENSKTQTRRATDENKLPYFFFFATHFFSGCWSQVCWSNVKNFPQIFPSTSISNIYIVFYTLSLYSKQLPRSWLTIFRSWRDVLHTKNPRPRFSSQTIVFFLSSYFSADSLQDYWLWLWIVCLVRMIFYRPCQDYI